MAQHLYLPSRWLRQGTRCTRSSSLHRDRTSRQRTACTWSWWPRNPGGTKHNLSSRSWTGTGQWSTARRRLGPETKCKNPLGRFGIGPVRRPARWRASQPRNRTSRLRWRCTATPPLAPRRCSGRNPCRPPGRRRRRTCPSARPCTRPSSGRLRIRSLRGTPCSRRAHRRQRRRSCHWCRSSGSYRRALLRANTWWCLRPGTGSWWRHPRCKGNPPGKSYTPWQLWLRWYTSRRRTCCILSRIFHRDRTTHLGKRCMS